MCFFETVPKWQTFSPKKSEGMLKKTASSKRIIVLTNGILLKTSVLDSLKIPLHIFSQALFLL